MTIKKAVAFKISLGNTILSEGFCGVSSKPDGSMPSDDDICKSVLRAAIDNGSVDVEKLPDGAATQVAVDLLWAKDGKPDPIMDVMRLALEACPEIVQRYKGGKLAGDGNGIQVDASTGEVLKSESNKYPPMPDNDFLKACGIQQMGEC